MPTRHMFGLGLAAIVLAGAYVIADEKTSNAKDQPKLRRLRLSQIRMARRRRRPRCNELLAKAWADNKIRPSSSRR